MKQQTFSNHLRFYPSHHFVFYPVAMAGIAIGIKNALANNGSALEWGTITALFVMLAWLSFMVRQHYALTNQNRTVRLEMRLRYYILTQKRLEVVEQQLSFQQIAALRFASDEELPTLIDQAVNEKMQPSAIKKAIKNWKADDMRV